MRIYTRTGDSGTTGLIGGNRAPKSDGRFHVLGDLDELNAALGFAQAWTDDLPILLRLQSWIFDVGAELATPKDSEYFQLSIDGAPTELLERDIDERGAQLPELRNFILPGGCELAARLHLARSVCRRAERSLVAFAETTDVRPELLAFVNRLSDWLFVAARWANHQADYEDILWKKS